VRRQSGRKSTARGKSTLLKGERRGRSGGGPRQVGQHVEGLEERGAWLPPAGDSSCGMTRPVGGDAGSLTSGARRAAGGREERETRARVGQHGGAGSGPSTACACGRTGEERSG
jgi:hypothetical protein